MAATRLIALHVNKGKTIARCLADGTDYSENAAKTNDGLKSNTSKVRNIKKFLLAALFNAPTTISGYYQALVNHDMPQFAKTK